MFDPQRHTALSGAAWSSDEARAVIDTIAQDTIAAFQPTGFWPGHPLDDDPQDSACIYYGSAGVIWALDYLRRQGIDAASHDFRAHIETVIARCASLLTSNPLAPYGSLLIGDLGALLLAMRLEPSNAMADRIFARAQDNNSLPVLELMWGTPGSIAACLFMRAMTGEPRFEQLYRVQAERLLADLHRDTGSPLWTQHLYGQERIYLGAVHGFAGNMAPLLAGWDLLTVAQRDVVQTASIWTLSKQARTGEAGTEWPPVAVGPEKPYLLCQHCHGSPGIVTVFADAPFSTPDFDQLLIGGGELTWNAGPLAKGSNLCHGTAGNGYPFLKLYRRTGNELWLDRARQFAMISIAQWRAERSQYGMGRHSLWTGDPGLAVYLLDCIRADPQFPTIDVF